MAVCPPGVEPLLDAELAALGVKRRRVVRGGVEAELGLRQLYAANLWLRCATRVVVRVATFNASGFAELEHRAAMVDWDRWVPAGTPVALRVTSHRSRLDHTGAIAERLAAAAGAQLVGLGTADPDGADHRRDDDRAGAATVGPARFVVRVDRDRFTISADSSGEPLYHRGWRRQVAKAPVRPTVAAAVLAAIGWPGDPAGGGRRLLVDPMCGSGTVAIEAARWACGLPPAVGDDPDTPRSYAFERWADFAAGTWASVLGEATARRQSTNRGLVSVVATDRDAGAVAATTANAGRAGVDTELHAHCAALSASEPPDGPPPGPGDMAWVVTNPPWGGRVGGGDLRDLYATLGNVVRQRFAGWRVAMVVADRHLAAHSGLGLHDVLTTTSGGQPVQLLVTDPIAGGATTGN